MGRWNSKDLLAVGGSSQFVSIYEIEILNGDNENNSIVHSKYMGSLKGHGNSINCICFHPDMNGLVLTASADQSIRLWDLNLCYSKHHHHHCGNNINDGTNGNGKLSCSFETIAIFHSHLAGIISLSFHQSGDYFVSGGMDNTCRVFKLNDERVKNYRKFKTRYLQLEQAQNDIHSSTTENNCNSVNGNDDGITIFTNNCTINQRFSSIASDSMVVQVPSIQSSIVYSYHRGYVDSCLFLGDLILSKSNSSDPSSTNDPGDSVIVWKPDCVSVESGFNVDSGEQDEISIVHRFKGSQSYFWWLKMAISDKYLARPLHDGRVELFAFENVGLSFYSRPCAVLHHSNHFVRECIFSRDSKYLFILQSNGSITRWSIN